MSSTTMRHQHLTLSFLPRRRDRQISHAFKTIKTRMSRRRMKQTLRSLIS